jgi:hypothetical protein
MSFPAAHAQHTEPVRAPFDLIRALLEEKVYHPERSIAAASNVRIERDGGAAAGVERRMFLATKGPAGADVHELITWACEGEAGARRFTVTFTTLSDPLTRGWVTNVLQEQGAGGDPLLTYEMRWDYTEGTPAERRSTPLFPDASALMRGAVNGLKAAAEAKAAAEDAVKAAATST